ncbi:MAG TPA: hypothetical protein VHO47_01335 [Candidatus Babeliales bacterium]|nr:hypothetical protein [Candidatus Babeliales bacterium]
MNWKEELKKLEDAREWDEAIAFMQKVIDKNPDNMDAYMFMNYLLINLLVEDPDRDISYVAKYAPLAKWYFDESYAKFSENAEYLYITATIGVIGDFFWKLDLKDIDKMFRKANILASNNLVYKDLYYYDLRSQNAQHPELIAYCKMILSENSPIKEQFQDKGSLGKYIIGLKEGWCEGVLYNASKLSTHQRK